MLTLSQDTTFEVFDRGSAFALKDILTVKNDRRVFNFYASARLDGLEKREELEVWALASACLSDLAVYACKHPLPMASVVPKRFVSWALSRSSPSPCLSRWTSRRAPASPDVPVPCSLFLLQNRKIIEHFTGRDDRLLYRSATYAEDPLGAAAGANPEGPDVDMPGDE